MSQHMCGGTGREYAYGNGEKSEAFAPEAAHGGFRSIVYHHSGICLGYGVKTRSINEISFNL
jgi:hypothetical protein